MTKLLFATGNRGKLREVAQLVADIEGLELLCLADLPEPFEIEEDGETFADNALLKARAAAEVSGLLTMADDSGLEVDALDGRPGVRSARYAGPDASDADKVQKLLGELRDVPRSRRTARFRCAVALVRPADGRVFTAEGRCEGRILTAPQGEGGFGYDPVFFVETLGCTFAEAEAAAKNELSHRGQALRAIAPKLRELLEATSEAP